MDIPAKRPPWRAELWEIGNYLGFKSFRNREKKKDMGRGGSVNFIHLNQIFNGFYHDVKSRCEITSNSGGDIAKDTKADLSIMRCPSGQTLKRKNSDILFIHY